VTHFEPCRHVQGNDCGKYATAFSALSCCNNVKLALTKSKVMQNVIPRTLAYDRGTAKNCKSKVVVLGAEFHSWLCEVVA